MGLSVAFVAADDRSDEVIDGPQVVGRRRYRHRAVRMVVGPISVCRAGMKMRTRVLKLHDPELLLLMPMMKLFTRAKFVFDSHEDVPVQFW